VQKSTKLSSQPIICQILSFIPKTLVQGAVEDTSSDRYYKKKYILASPTNAATTNNKVLSG
jgi:hypothetical protein